MSLRNTESTYGSVSKFFHWLIFLLLLFMVTFGYLLSSVPKDYQPVAYNIHKLTGLTILVLMVLRALWALSNPKPALPLDAKPWEHVAEHTVHLLLYLVVIAMPLAGWIGAVAGGRPPHIGSFNIELPISESKALSHAAFEMHGTLAIMLIVLFSIHVLAALYHHFIRKDDILRRIMPHSRNR